MSLPISNGDVMVNEVFIEAKDAFLKALGPRERRLFQACTSEKLIEDIKQSEVFRPLGSTVQSLVDRISSQIQKQHP